MLDFVPTEVMSSNESLNEASAAASAPALRNTTVDLERFSNGVELAELLESNLLLPLFNNKHVDVKLKVELVPLKKNSLKKKKPLLYSNNKYILFTQLISRLKLEWKSSNKMWSLMGINPETKKPFDENGYALYFILTQIESYHKNINEYDNVVQKDENGLEVIKSVKSAEKTDKARKDAVEYALQLLVSCYEGNEVPAPDPDNANAVSIYKQYENFKICMDRFKIFVSNCRFEEDNTAVGASAPLTPPSPPPRKAKGKVQKNVKGVKSVKISEGMVSDMLDKSLI
ncbi:39k protein [Spodoptera litura granulovirus]|uniref:39k protein n=1 Tax=Spodoptera litura granulovirus TaxID=359919 RepID=A5IZQ0_9BBAC|nr:39k protein [Spodoptera litura granulovirus]ABQ51991.1 39k protein [Spodoptera litura granulovirus]